MESMEEGIDGRKGNMLIWNESKEFCVKVLTRHLVTRVPRAVINARLWLSRDFNVLVSFAMGRF